MWQLSIGYFLHLYSLHNKKKRCCHILLQQQRITSFDMKQIGIIANKISAKNSHFALFF